MNETIYTIALSRLPGINLSIALRLYEKYGSAEAIFALKNPPEDMNERGKKMLMEAISNRKEVIERAKVELDYCNEKGIQTICFNDARYPNLLRNCDDAPLILFYLGTADLNTKRIISVVGTRRITEYGKDLCRNFCCDLARLLPDTLVVSGLAYGVDIHIHRGCLENNLDTVAVLAHGLDRVYPALHRLTAAKMTKHGGLLTEFLTQTQPKPENFVRRNRIVAGMSVATVVIESAERGGALITARLAQDYNRNVFAFPGRANDQYSQGCNNLISNNVAGLISSAEDFVKQMGWEVNKKKHVQRELFPDLTEQEKKVCQLLAQDDRKQLNQLVVESGISVSILTSVLFDLELKGIVKPIPGGRYRLLK